MRDGTEKPPGDHRLTRGRDCQLVTVPPPGPTSCLTDWLHSCLQRTLVSAAVTAAAVTPPLVTASSQVVRESSRMSVLTCHTAAFMEVETSRTHRSQTKPQPPQTSTNPLIPLVLTSAKSISQWCRRRGVSLCTLSGSRKHNLCFVSGPRRHLLSSAPRGHTRRRRNTPQEYLKTCHLLNFPVEFLRRGVAAW